MIDFNSLDHVLDVAVTGVGDERDGVQKVVDDHWLEHVEFKVALRAGESYGGGRSVDLRADHGHGFALRRIDFAGHDRRSRFVLRDGKLAQSAAGTGGQPANVV